ncbi:hypothetical protein CIT26_24530 [Mesorhizobium temperatum]|uniref:Uncharacterized protein n=1 Tax=Mesorhizobium temperatum TaxID=241416 RepID=A0A271LFW7_9HYPH|nr:hypothetical protein CIT26_24530 [Mesorhizobium temperatum]
MAISAGGLQCDCSRSQHTAVAFCEIRWVTTGIWLGAILKQFLDFFDLPPTRIQQQAGLRIDYVID